MTRIISIVAFFVIVFSFVPIYNAEAINEEGMRVLCREEIAKQFELQPVLSSGNPNDPATLEGRITNLESKVSLMEQIVRAIFNLVVQVMDTVSKLIK